MDSKVLLELEAVLISSYQSGVTMAEAERLAGRFLHAQMLISSSLRDKDLDSRMRKAGVKAMRSGIYTEVCSKADKKPTEATIDALINTDDTVLSAQREFDTCEVERDELERYYNIFREAHVYFRGIAKGRFE